MDLFNISDYNHFGLNVETKSASSIIAINKGISNRQNDDPLLKTYYPIYLYKPPFGYPRNMNVVFLRELARNPYVFSVIKAITDQAASTKWNVVPKKNIDLTLPLEKIQEEYGIEIDLKWMKELGLKTLEDVQQYIEEFFHNPNSDYEGFSQLLRKVIPDI